ncbi:hypothetical protein SCUP234_08264 [Seiridium cupressi]
MSEIDYSDFFRTATTTYHQKTYPFIDPTRKELSTKGKTAIVTGAGQGGIGHAIAQSLAKSGISAIGLIGRTEATLQQTKDSIEKLSKDTRVYVYAGVDVKNGEAVKTALDSFVGSTGSKIDILAANAGYMPLLSSIADADPEDWWHTFEVNIKGNFNLLRAYVPHAAQNGAVVHTSTSAIHIPYMPGYSAYRGSKLGATKVFEYFAQEMKELGNGVTTVQIHPGMIHSTMSKKFESSVVEVPYDDVELSGDFVNWAASDEAKFLDGKFVSANWDAEELLQRKEEIAGDKHLYTMDLIGWSDAYRIDPATFKVLPK